jgi:hypothetical protein
VFINAGWATYVVSGILRQIIKIILLIINWWFKKSLDLSFPPILFLVSSINQTYSFLSIILIFWTNFNHSRVNFNNFLNFAQNSAVQKMMVFCTSAQNERCPDRFFGFFWFLHTLHSSNAKIATIRYADRCENRPFSSPRDKKTKKRKKWEKVLKDLKFSKTTNFEMILNELLKSEDCNEKKIKINYSNTYTNF